MAKYIMALDAGTTSNRCILFDDTLVEPFSGVHFNNLGGVVSLGPPCGPLPRLAQPRMVRMQKATSDNILIFMLYYWIRRNYSSYYFLL